MKKQLFTFGALVGAGLVAASMFNVSQALAYQGDSTVDGPYHTEEREVAMASVMASKDFAGWKALMTEDGRNPGVLRFVDTQEDFDKFADAYTLEHDDNAENDVQADEIKAELGVGQGNGSRGEGTGTGMGSRGANRGSGSCVAAE